MTELPPVGAKIRATMKSSDDPDARLTIEGKVMSHEYPGAEYFEVGEWMISPHRCDIEILSLPFDPDEALRILQVWSGANISPPADALKGLNNHLSSGGKLPEAWKDATR